MEEGGQGVPGNHACGMWGGTAMLPMCAWHALTLTLSCDCFSNPQTAG